MAIIFKNQKKSPGFAVGEIVRIKPVDEIINSLDSTSNSLDGCIFTAQMRGYCESKYEVLKIVNSIFNEHKQRTFTTRSTLYILKNLICDGITQDFPYKCDHSCFLLWHEKWLEEV